MTTIEEEEEVVAEEEGGTISSEIIMVAEGEGEEAVAVGGEIMIEGVEVVVEEVAVVSIITTKSQSRIGSRWPRNRLAFQVRGNN